MRTSIPFFVRPSEPATRTPSWLAPSEERDVRALRWSLAPEPQAENAPSMRPVTMRPSISVIPEASPSVELRMPTPPAVPVFDDGAFEREVASIAATFAEATASVEAQVEAYRAELKAACEREAVKLAFVVAARIIGAEVATRPEIALAWAREGTEVLMGEGAVEIRMGEELAEMIAASGATTPIVCDPSLGPTGIRVVGERGHVDAGLGVRLKAIFDDVEHEVTT